jgi:ribosomal protein S18 acetylase RimI-like enzyme
MAETPGLSHSLRPATAAEIPVLASVWYDAFHPVSPFMRQVFPDTPLIREYWTKANTYALNDPHIRTMVVASGATKPEQVIAVARFQAPPADGSVSQLLDAGTWSRIPWTTDHDVETLSTAVAFQSAGREKAMKGKRHYFIELLATKHEFKGKGAGKMLIDWVCEQADNEQVEVFVDTNKDIVKFYERFGFIVQEKMVMPGDIAYEQYLLVRPARTTD